MVINVLVDILNADNCTLLGYYAKCSRNFWPKFAGQLIVPIFSGQESKVLSNLWT